MKLEELFIIPELGLCNRLRAIASAKRLGCLLNCQVTAIWDWGQWDDLFEQDPSLKIIRKLPPSIAKIIPIRTNWSNNGGGVLNQNLALDERLCVIRTCHAFSIASCAPVNSATLKDFYPKPALSAKALVENFARERFLNKTVGVHIRRTDNYHSKKHSPDCVFIEAVAKIMDENNLVFLGTDNQDTLNLFVERFGSSILTHTKKSSLKVRWPRASNMPLEVLDDWIDLLLLARCDYVLGSWFSSFSETAIALNGNPESRLLKINQ